MRTPRAETLHAVVLLAVVGGLGASIFAAYETTHPAAASFCSLNPFLSCSRVDASGYTTILGIQDWLIGVTGFAALLALDVPLYVTWRRELLLGFVGLSSVGVAVSAYLGYVELAKIGALCPVCLSAYVANLIAWAFALSILRSSRKLSEEEGTRPSGQSTPGMGET